MPFTREHGVLRILIGCLDQSHIDKMNVFIVDGFYKLTFKIEVPEGDPMLDVILLLTMIQVMVIKSKEMMDMGNLKMHLRNRMEKKCFKLNGSYCCIESKSDFGGCGVLSSIATPNQ
jgi:hypothetical protein